MGSVKNYARENGKNVDDLPGVMKSADYKKYVMADLANLAKEHKLSGLEKPRDIFLTDDAFSVDNNLLTPTFKLKRNVARDYFKP